MIIDSHVHIGFGGAIVASAADLVASMRRAGIDRAMVFAGALNDCPTAKVIEAAAPYSGTLFAVGSISPTLPRQPSPAQVGRWLRENKIFALKFYPGYEYFYPADRRLRPYLAQLAKYGRPAIFHSGDTYSVVGSAKLKYAHPLGIDDLAAAMPELKIVMAHVGWPWTVDAAEVVYKNKNVRADLSGFVYERFSAGDRRRFRRMIGTYVDIVGSTERLLFGTDWPIAGQGDYLRAVREVFGRDPKVFAGNAIETFGLKD